MPPAAEPCTARPEINCATVFDHPHMADPIANSTKELSNEGLRPQMSAALPQTGVTAALVSRYAEPIQIYAVWDCSSYEMEGTAVVMMEKSSAPRNRENWGFGGVQQMLSHRSLNPS